MGRCRRGLFELLAGRRLVLGDEPACFSRRGQIRPRVAGRPHALLDDAPQSLDERGHPAHEAAEDVVAQERDAEREPKTYLRLHVRERADSMERPDEDQQRHDGRDTEDGRRRLLKGRGLGGWHLISIVGDDLPRASRKKGTPSETSLTCDISRGRDANPARRYEDGRYQDRRREIVEQRHPWAGPQRGPRSPGRPRFLVAAAD